MSRYRVRFLKVVANDTGHEQEICQREVEVDAPDVPEAVAAACTAFCAAEQCPDWRRHADRLQVEPVS
jgi:hypothetical protein